MRQGLRLLVSGVTGQLGAGLTEVSEAHGLELVPVLRDRHGRSPSDRVARIFPARPELARAAVRGDVGLPAWGLAGDLVEELAETVDGVLNLAGVTNWVAPRGELFAANALGPVHGWELARRLQRMGGRCRVYCHASSVHVAGALEGFVAEAPLGPDGTRTRYEHSKWLGEHSLLAAVGKADGAGPAAVVARLGGLVGSLRGGPVPARRTSLYMLADRLDQLPGGLLPICRGGRVDMLPRDVAAGALARVVAASAAAWRSASGSDRIVHVCAGEEAPRTRAVLSLLESLDLEGLRRAPRAVDVPASWIAWLTQNVDRVLPVPPAWQNAVIGLRYLSLDRVFERSELARLIGHDLPGAPLEDLVRLVFELPGPAVRSAAPPAGLARFRG